LGHAEIQQKLSCLFALPGGYDNSRIGHGDTDACRNFSEYIVTYRVAEGRRVDVMQGEFSVRYGMRADAEYRFKCSACMSKAANS
jgi:hypothetical protein